MNAKKKKLESQEGSQEQWKHTSTHWIFSLVFLMNKINSERFPPCFWYAPFLFVDQCMQKKTQNLRKGAQSHEELEPTRSFVCEDAPLWQ